MDQYYPPDRLLDIKIGSIINVNSEHEDWHYSATLVGADAPHSIITTLPAKHSLAEGFDYNALFSADDVFEMRSIHNGHIFAFESAFIAIHNDRWLISSFPEMVETRPLRCETRFPCALSCDIHQGNEESYGVISNISHGGCQLSVNSDANYPLIESSLMNHKAIELVVFFPHLDTPITLEAYVKSSQCQVDGACKVGIAFAAQYEAVRQYLESLQLDSVTPFFS